MVKVMWWPVIDLKLLSMLRAKATAFSTSIGWRAQHGQRAGPRRDALQLDFGRGGRDLDQRRELLPCGTVGTSDPRFSKCQRINYCEPQRADRQLGR
jgi:hypothetical protein